MLLKKIKNHLSFRLNQALIYKEHLNIKKQIPTASIIYDAICNKKDISEIKKTIKLPLSQEIYAILNKLETIGYINDIKPLTKVPTVSVIIPHFNHHQYLDEALFHLSNQTSIPEEVIIVDDQSKNQTLLKSIYEKYLSSLNLKLIIPPKKLFAGGCRQLGAETATSDLITMHDADDISHPNRIELTKRFFQEHPDALHLNFGTVRFEDNFFHYLKNFTHSETKNHIVSTETIAKQMRKRFIKQQFSSFNQYQIRLGCYGVNGKYFWGCSSGHTTYRKEVCKRIKWTSPTSYVFTKFEDYDFNLLLFLAGQRSYQIDLPLIYYRIGSTTNVIK
ncbi:MAG: glycosyltransferase family 2 protein [Methanosarcinaceae archaeon]